MIVADSRVDDSEALSLDAGDGASVPALATVFDIDSGVHASVLACRCPLGAGALSPETLPALWTDDAASPAVLGITPHIDAIESAPSESADAASVATLLVLSATGSSFVGEPVTVVIDPVTGLRNTLDVSVRVRAVGTRICGAVGISVLV